MTVELDLFNAIKSLVSDRVYPDLAPLNATKPYITYQQVGGSSVNFVAGSVPSKKNGRFQINCWASTRLAAATLARQVEDTLRPVAALQTTVLAAPVAVYEEDTKLFGMRQDFSFWHSN